MLFRSASFARQLKPIHWQALAAFVQGEELSIRLDAIARREFTTANLMIEDINAFALNSIGDIVIDTADEFPVIEAESMEGIRLLIAWASNKSYLEY